jgi:hypothetical protein
MQTQTRKQTQTQTQGKSGDMGLGMLSPVVFSLPLDSF